MVAGLQGAVLKRVRALPPSDRARWLLGLLALPWAVGATIVALTLGHCVAPMVLGGVDDCVPGLGLCVREGAPVGRGTIALAVLVSLRPMYALWHAARGVRAARRAARRLRSLGEPCDVHGGWRVPGALAVVLGFPKEELFVGEALRVALGEPELRALVEHESAHRTHRDVWRRIAARVLASAHFDAPARELLSELDLAIEQRCDEHASERVEDPLVVARAILRAATVRDPHAPVAATHETPATLPARIQALCTPSWASQPALGVAAFAALAVAVLAGLAFDHHVHRAAETLLAALARA
jgi:hypothetical protein